MTGWSAGVIKATLRRSTGESESVYFVSAKAEQLFAAHSAKEKHIQLTRVFLGNFSFICLSAVCLPLASSLI